MPSLLCRLQILVGWELEQSIPIIVHTVPELSLWSKRIEWSHPSTMSSYSESLLTWNIFFDGWDGLPAWLGAFFAWSPLFDEETVSNGALMLHSALKHFLNFLIHLILESTFCLFVFPDPFIDTWISLELLGTRRCGISEWNNFTNLVRNLSFAWIELKHSKPESKGDSQITMYLNNFEGDKL